MVPVEKLLDPYSVSLGCHTAAASPAIPGSIIATPWKITILPRCSSNNAKVSVSFETTITLFLASLPTNSPVYMGYQPGTCILDPVQQVWNLFTTIVTVASSDSSSETRELAMIVTLPWTLLHSISLTRSCRFI